MVIFALSQGGIRIRGFALGFRAYNKMRSGRAVFWRAAGPAMAGRDEGAWPKRPVTEEQRRQAPARKQPSGLPIFAAAAALLVGRISLRAHFKMNFGECDDR